MSNKTLVADLIKYNKNCKTETFVADLQLFAKFLDHPVHFCQTHSDTIRHSQTHKNFLIFRLSIDLVIVERCIIARWNRLVETNRMVANLSFYDRWIARYLTKRQESAFLHLHYCAI